MTTSPHLLLVEPGEHAIPISAIAAERLEPWLAAQTAPVRHWLSVTGFRGEAGSIALMSDPHGEISRVVFGLGRGDDPWVMGALAKALPKGLYRVAESFGEPPDFATWSALAWALGAYAFGRYKSEPPQERARLHWPDGCDRPYVANAVQSVCLARDLVNTPASDLLPDGLEQAARDVAAAFAAEIQVIRGDDLLAANYPMIHAVGRASAVPPRLIDIRWGNPSAPKVTLVGKGVCFDSGGLDLKTASGMALMKKDMGGAAVVLGLSRMIMCAALPVRLRVLIPAVENAVSGNAFRPGDVLTTRRGLSVEIGNTDAEGRLVLADALAEAASENPAILFDCATLTGAARTALGPDLPALFTDDEALAREVLDAAGKTRDPLWRLPLWQPYRKMLDSKIADINNAGDSAFAGAITAALFLREFVKPKDPASGAWAHLDLYAWNPSDRPGRPVGGEGMAIRALYEVIRARFAR